MADEYNEWLYCCTGIFLKCSRLEHYFTFDSWCNPCKVLTPRLDAIIAEQDGKVDLAKVDIDVMGELAFNFGVNAVPTVIGMKGGKVINKFEGVVEPPQIRHFIEQLTKA
ncbi:thioredoxin, mitochondrial-like [Nematostella vectensis]|uniref:thioredoxin, mitochondrial-like n=1 Tax=Nematostella vectensis TaxID=45351 RepID=UPI00207731C1|nr:thioredoxin, mitochondrial-like [Nematostella vectensis]